MSKILVLGGAGFIGSNLVLRLLDSEHHIRVFTRSGKAIGRIASERDRIELVYGDFMDEYSLKKALEGVDFVYHLITTTFPETTRYSGIYDIQSNLIPSMRLLEACEANNVKKIIYASSGGTIYGEPEFVPITEEHPLKPASIYGLSKMMIENYMSFFALNSSVMVDILRISNPYGPGQNLHGAQGLISVAMGRILSDVHLDVIGGGKAVRDYIFIDDVVDSMVRCLDCKDSILCNISAGRGKSVVEILDMIESVTGKKIKRRDVSERLGYVQTSILSNEKAMNTIGWSPKIGLEEGVKKTWEWASRSFASA